MADVPTDLFRSSKRSDWKGKTSAAKGKAFTDAAGAGSLYPDYVGFERNDGSFRAPDVTSFKDDKGTWWIRGVEDRKPGGQYHVNWKEGVSLSVGRGGFGYDRWFYFLLPQGTNIPASLDIAHTPSQNDNGHYSLRCRTLIRQDAYEGALNTLARNAIAKAVELKKQSLYFTA